MRIADQKLDDEHYSLDTSNSIYMYQHEDISGMKVTYTAVGSAKYGQLIAK